MFVFRMVPNWRPRTGSVFAAIAAASLLACGGGGGGGGSTAASGSTSTASLSLLAGSAAGIGSRDGTGSAAGFNLPDGVAVDSAGNVYVADSANQTIRKVSATGVVTTLAGVAGQSGSADGLGQAARFKGPQGVALDASGNVYVTDAGNHTIRKITPAGSVTTIAGLAGTSGSADGSWASARFKSPMGIAVDGAGNLYVADTGNYTIRVIATGGTVTTLAGTPGVRGASDATGGAASFDMPFGIAVDASGNLFVADAGNHTIRKVTPAGVVSTFAGTSGAWGGTDATGAAARFTSPQGIAIDAVGNLYVADTNNELIRKVSPGAVVTTLAGTVGVSGSLDAPVGTAATFHFPRGVAVAPDGNVYVADSYNFTVRKIAPAGAVTTLAGSAPVEGNADGPGDTATFKIPQGFAVDQSGTLYVADTGNCLVRKISSAGLVSTLSGSCIGAVITDIVTPFAVAADNSGNVYIADTLNHAIRKLSAVGTLSTFAGTPGSAGSNDDPVAGLAGFNYPQGIAVDNAGTVYVADTDNHTIRKITSAGAVTTLAGTAGVPGSTDGLGGAARFNGPFALAADGAGNVYVSDNGNRTIRRISPAGDVVTVAGMAGQSGAADGVGTSATFGSPSGLAVDSSGNLYVADTANHTVRKISPSGVVSTVVGAAGRPGFVAGSLPGGLTRPIGLALHGNTLYVTTNNAVAKVTNLP